MTQGSSLAKTSGLMREPRSRVISARPNRFGAGHLPRFTPQVISSASLEPFGTEQRGGGIRVS